MKPIGDHLPGHHRSRFAGEDQKGRLKGILCIVVIADNTPANSQDHWTVAKDERLKSRYVLPIDEGVEQLSICPVFAFPQL